jgi:predicted AlkP superfamily pyrophosphatase or phosphodiesterase
MTRLLSNGVLGALACLGVLSYMAVTHAALPPRTAPNQSEPIVVLVSIDGFASYYLNDPKAHIPTLRRMAREGAVAKGLLCSFPTVTWPNHTTLVTGVTPAQHGVIGNNVLNRETGTAVAFIPDPLFDKDEIVKAPTIYEAAHSAGLTTAGIIWPATRNAAGLDFTVPDMRGQESWEKYGTASWLAELRAEGLPVDRYGAWVESASGGVQRDWLYTEMACCTWSRWTMPITQTARKARRVTGRSVMPTTACAICSMQSSRRGFASVQRCSW